jgi:hypothetical protein
MCYWQWKEAMRIEEEKIASSKQTPQKQQKGSDFD